MKEQNIQSLIQLAASKIKGVVLFRNNTAMGWAGSGTKVAKAGPYFLNAGDVIVKAGRPLHAGLTKGSSDLIGWKSQEITPDMVGQTVAVFSAVEVKQPGKNPTEEQSVFIRNVRKAGGVAGTAHSESEAVALLS